MKVETYATPFTASADLNLTTASQFEFVSDLAELTANLGYDLSSYFMSDLPQLQIKT